MYESVEYLDFFLDGCSDPVVEGEETREDLETDTRWGVEEGLVTGVSVQSKRSRIDL